jgi:hypothetical protein
LVRDERPDANELVLAVAAHGGLEVDQPGQPPRSAWAFDGQQMLPHDLGMHQHRRPRRQRDLIDEASQLVRP